MIAGREQPPQPLPKLVAIISAHGFIANRTDHLREPRLECGAPLGRVEASRFRLAHPQHVRERPRAANDLMDGIASTDNCERHLAATLIGRFGDTTLVRPLADRLASASASEFL